MIDSIPNDFCAFEEEQGTSLLHEGVLMMCVGQIVDVSDAA
jgi:hypothetical protein